MTELTGIAKTIYDETMDEIGEELQQAFEGVLAVDLLNTLITDLQDTTSDEVTQTILDNYSEGMNAAKKMILGEKLSRVVTAVAKKMLNELMTDVLKRSFDVVDELRNEIIGEVFEETE